MKFIYDDGGRANCGFKGKTGDCVARAVSIVTQRPYSQVYFELAAINSKMKQTKNRQKGFVGVKTAANGIYTNSKLFKDYMAQLGFVWTACMKPGTGCKVHLADNELPMGRLVVKLSRHLSSVIDGVIHDTYNPQRDKSYNFEPDRGQDLKANQGRNENGVWTEIGGRCVYGYYTLEK
jgi:hypothetical protein